MHIDDSQQCLHQIEYSCRMYLNFIFFKFGFTGLIFVLATSPDSRPRILKATKEWDFSPLLQPWIGTESL